MSYKKSQVTLAIPYLFFSLQHASAVRMLEFYVECH